MTCKDGELSVRYVQALGETWAETRFSGSTSATFWHHTDHEGTSEVITDSTGSIVWEASYEAYGAVIRTNATMSFTPSYTGKEFDSDIGLYYHNARWYDPDLGRFITEDPARDGVNWFAYCNENPIRYIDPDGRVVSCDENTDQSKVEASINSYSYYQYKFNEDGLLEKTDGVNNSGSKDYSSAVDSLINRTETISIGLYDDSNIASNNNPYGTNDCTLLPPSPGNDIKIYVYSNNKESMPMENGQKQTAPVERKLMHEIAGHAAPFVNQQRRNAVDIENCIMAEIFGKILLYPQDAAGRVDAYNRYIKRKDSSSHRSY